MRRLHALMHLQRIPWVAKLELALLSEALAEAIWSQILASPDSSRSKAAGLDPVDQPGKGSTSPCRDNCPGRTAGLVHPTFQPLLL